MEWSTYYAAVVHNLVGRKHEGRNVARVWRLYIQIEILDGGQMSKQSNSNNHDISKMFSVTGYCSM